MVFGREDNELLRQFNFTYCFHKWIKWTNCDATNNDAEVQFTITKKFLT